MQGAWASWRAAADSVGGAFELRLGEQLAGLGRTPSTPTIAAVVDGCPVSVVLARVDTEFHTRITAEAPGATWLRLDARPRRTVLDWLQGRAGVGDTRWDEQFSLEANDVAFARAWMDEPARTALCGTDGYALALNRRHAVLQRRGYEEDPEALGRSVRALVAVARSGERLRAAWVTLGRSLGGQVAADDQVIRVDHRGTTVELRHDLALAPRERPFCTTVACRRVAIAPGPFALWRIGAGARGLRGTEPRIDPGVLAPGYEIAGDSLQHMARRLVNPALELLDDCAPLAVLARDSAIEVLLEGLVVDTARIRAAIALAELLAIEVPPASAGPYR